MVAEARNRVLYLTGAPATGKSTLVRALRDELKTCLILSYGELLTDIVRSRGRGEFSQADLRADSAFHITPQDVSAADRSLIETVARERVSRHVLIDSHPVTKESYGFRCTAFSHEQLLQFKPTELICLYAPSDVIRKRIEADSSGRRMPTAFEADAHTYFQASVVLTYAVLLGCPVYFVDSSTPTSELVKFVSNLLTRRSGKAG